MKRHFSCVMMIITMFLFGVSGVMQGSALVDIAEVGLKSLSEAGVEVEGDEAQALVKSMQSAAKSSLTAITDKYAAKMAESGADEAALKVEMEAEVKSVMDSMAQPLTKVMASGIKATAITADVLAKLGTGSVEDFSTAMQKLVTDGAMSPNDAKVLTSAFKDSKTILTKATTTVKNVASSISGKLNQLMGKSGDGLLDAEKKSLTDAQSVLADTASTDAQRAAAAKTVNDLEIKAGGMTGRIVRGLTELPGMARELVIYGGGTMAAAVLFMIPSIFQSSFLAQEAQDALLQTYLPPIKFGGIVMQLADSVINMSNPAQSQFIYYGIPVNNPGDALSPAAKAAYPGVTGPTAKNKISAAVSNSYAQAFSGGGTKKISIPRYNLDASALATLPIFVSYSSQSYIPYASNGIPDAAFSQSMLNLNTGGIIFADGTSDGNAPVPLVGPKQSSGFDTIQSFMTVKLGALKTTGMDATYTQYQNSYSSSKASKVSNPIAQQFDCSCLQANNGVLSPATLKTCSAGASCLLTQQNIGGLNQLAAGIVINSQGKALQPGQNVATEVANGALGQVIPIQGLGAQLNTILQAFPGAQQTALASSGALTVSIGSNLQSAAKVTIQGADQDNYAAKGIYVYQCKNTPLAKIMRSQSGGSQNAASQITDYIVFLDTNLNQVPLMTPVANPNNYGFLQMGLNPAIKYFSTILGNTDSSGNFSFLPQLNIQSPAALVAKGLPATFAPLYGLTATNGSLAVNYNQNLTTAIGTIAQSLSSNPKLGQQFKTMQAAMMSQLTAGPYGQYGLNPVAANMQPSIGGVTLVMYTGFNGYPVSQDQTNAACSDVLIPISAQGSTVTLPSSNVAQYYGIVTDLTYTVLSDGSITVGSNGYANSPFNPTTWSINQANVSQYYWMSKLTSMGNAPMPAALVSFVQAARAAWVKWIQSTQSSPEYLGITMPGGSSMLTIASQQALQNGLYIYTCAPSPSSTSPDYFVLTNSSAPQATDATLGTMSATKATSTTNMLSLTSGILYSSAGTPVANAQQVNVTNLLGAIQKAYPSGIANDLAVKLNIASGQTASNAMAMVYPTPFGTLQLGMYQADINTNTYLYFNAAGAGSSANFQPSDYFVTVDSYTSPSTIQTQISSTTAYIVSLVSGQVYGPNGVVATMPTSLVSQIISALSSSWRSGVAAQITALTSALTSSSQTMATQTTAMNNATVPGTGLVTWPQASALQVINGVSQANYLADPYSMLKQDPTSGMYVIVSPASADGTQFMYTFFSVPSSMTDANGNPINVGAAYDGQANLLRVIQGVELTSMFHQYGVAIDSSGKMYLGASNSLPVMQLASADLALQPGASGTSMICSNNPAFPSHGIVSPISYQNTSSSQAQNLQFYIYYNNLTQGYYAMQINGSDICYIDMAGGSMYNLNGSPRLQANPVAVSGTGSAMQFLLPYLNPDDFVRCMMPNADNNNAYSDFLNSETDFQADATDVATNNPCGLNLLYSLDAAASSVNVAQMPFPSTLTAMPDLSMTNQYNVYFDGSSTPITYNVNSAYTWQQLQILPINMSSRVLLNPVPAAQYTSAGLVMQGSAMYGLVFNGMFYSGAQQSGTSSYTMTSGTSTVTVAMLVDAKTNAQYVAVTSGGVTYNYQCSFATLSQTQLTNLQNNAWLAQPVPSIMGTTVLEEYISGYISGTLQLVPVSANSVANAPTGAAQSALAASLGSIMQDSGNGRFVATVGASTYSYVTQAGYVDLENGALFDSTGLVLGYALQGTDLLALLSQLSVSVVRNSSNVAVLTYQASSVVSNATVAPSSSVTQSSAGAASSSAASSSIAAPSAASSSTASSSVAAPSAGVVNYGMGTSVNSSFPSNSYVAPAAMTGSVSGAVSSSPYVAPSNVGSTGGANVSYQTATNPQMGMTSPIVSQPSMSAAPAMGTTSAPSPISNSQIVALQQELQSVKAAMTQRQIASQNEKVVNRQIADKNALMMYQNEITALTNQISTLQSGVVAAAAASRSNILGRLSSQASNKNKKAATKKAMKGMSL